MWIMDWRWANTDPGESRREAVAAVKVATKVA